MGVNPRPFEQSAKITAGLDSLILECSCRIAEMTIALSGEAEGYRPMEPFLADIGPRRTGRG